MADDQNIEQRITIALETAEAATSLKDLRGSIRDLNTLAEQVGVDSPEAFNKIKQAAGEATLKIKEMRDTTKALAGTPLTQTSNSFRLIRENLMTMNFDGLTKSVTLFAGSLSKLNPSGLTEGFGKLGSSLMTLGKTLLTNPIFLIGAAIALIIIKFDELKEMGGLVGKVFTAIGDAIHIVIKAITTLTDAIGLTDLAYEKSTKKMVTSLERQKEAIADRYEFEKKAAEETHQRIGGIEQKRITDEKTRAGAAVDLYEGIKKKKGKLTDEETAKYLEAQKDYNKIKWEEYYYTTELNDKIVDSEKEKLKKIGQAKIDNITNETAKKKAQAAFDLQNEKEEINKAKQERINSLKDEYDRRTNIIGVSAKDQLATDKWYSEQTAKINNQTTQEEQQATTKKNQEIAKAEKEEADKAEAERDKAAKKEEARVKKFEAEKNADRKLDEKLGVERRETEEKDKDKALKADEKRLAEIEKKTHQMLVDTNNDVEKHLKREAELKKQNIDKIFGYAQAGASALSALNDLITQNENQKLKAGEKLSIQLQKRQFERQKALGIISAIINTAQGITAALSQAPPYSFIMAALTGVTGALQIAKIASSKFNPESGGGGDTSAPTATAPSAATAPSLASNFSAGQFFGAGTARAQKADSNSNNRVYVVESDITSVQNRVAVTQTRSTLSGRH